MSILRVKESFAYPGKDGYTHSVNVDSLIDSNDPCVKGRENLFESVEDVAARVPGAVEIAAARAAVEDASAEPNEKRSVSTVKRGPGRPRRDGE